MSKRSRVKDGEADDFMVEGIGNDVPEIMKEKINAFVKGTFEVSKVIREIFGTDRLNVIQSLSMAISVKNEFADSLKKFIPNYPFKDEDINSIIISILKKSK